MCKQCVSERETAIKIKVYRGYAIVRVALVNVFTLTVLLGIMK